MKPILLRYSRQPGVRGFVHSTCVAAYREQLYATLDRYYDIWALRGLLPKLFFVLSSSQQYPFPLVSFFYASHSYVSKLFFGGDA